MRRPAWRVDNDGISKVVAFLLSLIVKHGSNVIRGRTANTTLIEARVSIRGNTVTTSDVRILCGNSPECAALQCQ